MINHHQPSSIIINPVVLQSAHSPRSVLLMRLALIPSRGDGSMAKPPASRHTTACGIRIYKAGPHEPAYMKMEQVPCSEPAFQIPPSFRSNFVDTADELSQQAERPSSRDVARNYMINVQTATAGLQLLIEAKVLAFIWAEVETYIHEIQNRCLERLMDRNGTDASSHSWSVCKQGEPLLCHEGRNDLANLAVEDSVLQFRRLAWME